MMISDVARDCNGRIMREIVYRNNLLAQLDLRARTAQLDRTESARAVASRGGRVAWDAIYHVSRSTILKMAIEEPD